MKLFFLREGLQFTLYSLEMTDESVRFFIKNLEENDDREYSRVMRRLEQLAERGPSRRKTEFRPLGNDLYEAKTSGGSRIIFFYDENKIVICAYGFPKKTKKTPLQYLKNAKNFKRAYEMHKTEKKTFEILIAKGAEKPRRTP